MHYVDGCLILTHLLGLAKPKRTECFGKCGCRLFGMFCCYLGSNDRGHLLSWHQEECGFMRNILPKKRDAVPLLNSAELLTPDVGACSLRRCGANLGCADGADGEGFFDCGAALLGNGGCEVIELLVGGRRQEHHGYEGVVRAFEFNGSRLGDFLDDHIVRDFPI